MPITVSGTQITFNDATVQTTAFTGGGGAIQYSLATRATAYNSNGTPLVFNSTGNFTWTCPSGVTRVRVTVIAGGCGINNFGGYNGAGGIGIGVYTVTPGTAYSVLVGAAAAGVTGLGGVGAGGTSSFGSLISATGGSGGSGGGTNGASANANIRSSNANDWGGGPFGGISPSIDGLGGRSATIDWAINTQNSDSNRAPSPGATNPNNGFSVSGLVYIEYVG